MADFIDGLFLRAIQLAVCSNGAFLEETVNRLRRIDEILVAVPILVQRAEHALVLSYVKFPDDLLGSGGQRREIARLDGIRQDDKAVFLEFSGKRTF